MLVLHSHSCEKNFKLFPPKLQWAYEAVRVKSHRVLDKIWIWNWRVRRAPHGNIFIRKTLFRVGFYIFQNFEQSIHDFIIVFSGANSEVEKEFPNLYFYYLFVHNRYVELTNALEHMTQQCKWLLLIFANIQGTWWVWGYFQRQLTDPCFIFCSCRTYFHIFQTPKQISLTFPRRFGAIATRFCSGFCELVLAFGANEPPEARCLAIYNVGQKC